MTKSELIEIIDQTSINGWGIGIDYLSEAGFVLGCYYNQQDKKWHIYETDERGLEEPIFKADSEETAYDKLYDLVMIHKKLDSRHP